VRKIEAQIRRAGTACQRRLSARELAHDLAAGPDIGVVARDPLLAPLDGHLEDEVRLVTVYKRKQRLQLVPAFHPKSLLAAA
jgi:hypothetical protein